MKHSNTKRLSWMFGLMMILVLAAQPAKATPILTLGPLTDTGTPNEVTSILTLELDSGDSISSIDFDLEPTSLSFISVENLAPMDASGFFELWTIDINGLTIPWKGWVLTLLDPIGPGTSDLAKLTLMTDPGATPSLSLLNVAYTNAAGGATPVPEPATMLLLGSGLAGLGAMRSKRRQVATKKA